MIGVLQHKTYNTYILFKVNAIFFVDISILSPFIQQLQDRKVFGLFVNIGLRMFTKNGWSLE